MYYTYFIESISSGQWYYGSTEDLEKRLIFHNKEWGSSNLLTSARSDEHRESGTRLP